MTIVHRAEHGVSDRLTGTTTDAWVTILDWIAAGHRYKTLVISNTGALNSLDYSVLVRTEYDGEDAEQVAPVAVAAGDNRRSVLNNVYARVRVQVRATVAGNQTDYQLDYIGQP